MQVIIPSAPDKPEWRLNGQTVSLTLALTDSVTTLKLKLQDETLMPPAKQKISYEVSGLEYLVIIEYNFFFFLFRVCFSRIAIPLLFIIY